jgi:cell division protein FtsB
MKILLAILIALLLLLQYQLWFSSSGYLRAWHLRQALSKEQKTTQELTDRNKILEAEIQDLKQGHDAIEELARNQLGMVKKDETFYRIVPSTKNNPTGEQKK